jgi:hypothetical protein
MKVTKVVDLIVFVSGTLVVVLEMKSFQDVSV